MSRVVYTETAATAAQEALRVAHQVRVIAGSEEGTGVNALPAGVYGFTYSPALPNAPLFAVRRFRCYETHKLANEIFLIGFAAPGDAAAVNGTAEVSLTVQPEPDATATELVKVPYSRIRRHRQYAAPNEHGFYVTLN